MSMTGPNGEEAPDWLKLAGSIRELAEQIGIDPDALEATVERYNTYAEKGEDPDWGDPGQTQVLTGPDTVNRKPITGPTFGAIQQWPGTLGTNGGLRIDSSARVPFLSGVSISLRCTTYSKVDGGDHLVLIGRVEEVGLGEEMPFVYFRRKFHSLPLGAEEAAGRAPGRAILPVVIELDLGWM